MLSIAKLLDQFKKNYLKLNFISQSHSLVNRTTVV